MLKKQPIFKNKWFKNSIVFSSGLLTIASIPVVITSCSSNSASSDSVNNSSNRYVATGGLVGSMYYFQGYLSGTTMDDVKTSIAPEDEWGSSSLTITNSTYMQNFISLTSWTNYYYQNYTLTTGNSLNKSDVNYAIVNSGNWDVTISVDSSTSSISLTITPTASNTSVNYYIFTLSVSSS